MSNYHKEYLSWRDYLVVLFRRRWIFFIPLLFVSAVASAGSFYLPRIYEARSVVLVEEENIINPLISGLAVSTTVSQRLKALREKILSWQRLVKLVQDLDLANDVQSKEEFEDLIFDIRKNTLVEMPTPEVILIAYQGKDPYATQQIVNTITENFIKENIKSRTEETDTAIDFIRAQLDLYREKLEESEEALMRFKEIYLLEMPIASELNEQLVKLEVRLNSLLVDCTDEHPAVVELRNRIERLKKLRQEEIERAANAEGSAEDYNYYKEIAESIPKQEQELARLKRDTDVNEQIYAMLLERLETARISKRLEDSSGEMKFSVVEPARFPLKPIKPNRLHIGLLGTAVGVFLGFGAMLLSEFMDHSFSNIEDARSVLNMPALGAVSKVLSRRGRRKRFFRCIGKIFLVIMFIGFTVAAGYIGYMINP